MAELEIRPKAPIPPKQRQGARSELSRKLEALIVGESVVVPAVQLGPRPQSRASATAAQVAARIGCGVRYSTRKEGDGIAIWRVK